MSCISCHFWSFWGTPKWQPKILIGSMNQAVLTTSGIWENTCKTTGRMKYEVECLVGSRFFSPPQKNLCCQLALPIQLAMFQVRVTSMILYKQMISLVNLAHLRKPPQNFSHINGLQSFRTSLGKNTATKQQLEAVWNNSRTHIEPLRSTVHFEPEQSDVTFHDPIIMPEVSKNCKTM